MHRLVYITSLGHSGSTLLDLLIGAHSRALPVGSLRRIVGVPETSCSCGAPALSDCVYWQRIQAEVRETSGVELAELNIESRRREVFLSHNAALYDALARATGAEIIVESSKSFRRLRRLLSAQVCPIQIIHLVREPRGVVYSQVRKGRSLTVQGLRYGAQVASTRAWLRRHAHLEVRYEDLVARPEQTLGYIMDALGLELEPVQLDWASHERHVVGGNRMRDSRDSRIRLDDAAESGLGPVQKLLVDILAYPGRISW